MLIDELRELLKSDNANQSLIDALRELLDSEKQKEIDIIRNTLYEYRSYDYNNVTVHELINAQQKTIPDDLSFGIVRIESYGDDYSGCSGYRYVFKSREDVLNWLQMIGAKINLTNERETIAKCLALAKKNLELLEFFSSCESKV